MNRTVVLTLAGIALIVIAGFFTWQIPVKMKYDEARGQLLREAPSFVLHPVDAEAADFLQAVRDSWKVQDRECPDSIFSEIASTTGVDESVEGVVRFHTHEIPPYSFFNHLRNVEELAMAKTMAVALPISVDHRVYFKEGLCFLKLTENLVEVFEDRDEGLSRTLYSKSERAEEKGDQ